ncbi:MAG: hypothetical protein JWR10_4167 [Rubritepida sp.]|nr:hypothetical protein [Rubritepida sp.]
MPETIAEHAIAYNDTVERATDTQMLMNILRARDQAPMHFTTIGSIRGQLNAGAGLGYDGSTGLGNGLLASISGGTSPGFDIGPLDRQEFARGLMRPLDPTLFRVLWDRNMPDQLLIYLLVSRFDEGPGGRRAVNDPRLRNNLTNEQRVACAVAGLDAQPPCDRFQAMVDRLTANGPILFNGYTRYVPVGPQLTRAESTKPELLASLREPGVSLRPDGNGWRLMRAIEQMAICIPGPPDAQGHQGYTASAVDREPPQISPMSQAGNPCIADEVREASAQPGSGSPARGVAWYLRSVEEVLQYLGAVQRREEQGIPYRIDTTGRVFRRDVGVEAPRLFRLWPAEPPQSRISARYRGQRWWVAAHDDGEDLTLRVLGLATQLLNIQKAAGDISTSGTVRLVR